ncbi:hypothetical protein KDK95_21045 [Actinospica sp. MGRD01-02]|uniref:Uncharacterized protein n=1 Tax=Actinospica acidithermotolerans TaxID=2828514 RepID=A0A941IIX7_9ACTN|nr:hypothetical protein [Actinospica acidithermotolerans]MBR7828809.1 hypothetical protein [Actinospica acidithermotolerans]
MSGSSGGGLAEAGVIARTFLEMARLAQEAESMLPGFDRQMHVARDPAAAAQLLDAHNEFKAVQDSLERTWAQVEATVKTVLEARPEITPPR